MERLNIVEVFQLIYNLRDCISYYLHYLAHAFLSCFASMGLHKPHFSFAGLVLYEAVPARGTGERLEHCRREKGLVPFVLFLVPVSVSLAKVIDLDSSSWCRFPDLRVVGEGALSKHI